METIESEEPKIKIHYVTKRNGQREEFDVE